MNHFQKEVHPRKALYHALNRMRSGGTTNDKKKTGRPTSWTPDRKSQLQRLAYNRKVRGSHFFIYINDCFHPPASPRLELYFWPHSVIILERQWLGRMKMSTLCPKRLIHQMSPMHAQLRIFMSFWHKRFTREARSSS